MILLVYTLTGFIMYFPRLAPLCASGGSPLLEDIGGMPVYVFVRLSQMKTIILQEPKEGGKSNDEKVTR